MKKLIFLFLITLTLLPALSFAEDPNQTSLDYGGLVKCDGVVTATEEYRRNPCDFAELIKTVKSGINWLFVITIPIMTVFMAYGGILYMTGSQKNIGTAKSIFQSAGLGFIIMLIAWVSVVTVVNWFLTPDMQKVIKTFVNI
jgi:hypothetical protein